MRIYKKLRRSIFLDPAKVTIYDVTVVRGPSMGDVDYATWLIIGDYSYFTYINVIGFFRHAYVDVLSDIVQHETQFKWHLRNTRLTTIIRTYEMLGRSVLAEDMRHIILNTLRSECELFGRARTKCVRVRIPSIHNVPFHYIIRLWHKHAYPTIQWGRYMLDINYSCFKLSRYGDPIKSMWNYPKYANTRNRFINSIVWYDNTPALHTMDISMRDLNACYRARTNATLDDVIQYINPGHNTPKNFRARLREIFAHREFTGEHTRIMAALNRIMSPYLIPELAHIVQMYMGVTM
jgi:hypothetical protein